jgi:hypothetical protein
MFSSPSKSILNMPATPFNDKKPHQPAAKGFGGYSKSRKTSLDT